ncbi:MAG: hypothetical protein WC341_00435 [Bacteroidales bacterium]
MKDGYSLKEVFKDKIAALKELILSKIEALEKATILAYVNMEERLKGMNEFRAQLKDQVLTFITRVEHDAVVKKFEEAIQLLRNSNFITRAEFDSAIEAIKKDVQMLRDFKNLLEGKASQKSVTISYIMSAIGIIIALIGLLSK